ncbi:MAG: metallophosphoesterase, partial [Bacteroidota bacterium]
LELLSQQLAQAGKNSAVAFLGDNIPKVDWGNEAARAKAEASLNAQLKILENYKGKVFFLPGDNDWNKGRKGGLEAVQWQENYIEERLQNDEIFLPTNGCGDPETVKLDDNVVLAFINSQWWLQDWRPFDDINSGCEVKDRLGFLQEMRDVLKKNNDEFVVVLSHHPMFSNGNHGGSFSVKNHLFPFTTTSKNLYLPLPGIGSLAMLARQTGAHQQDIPHSHYLRLRNELMALLELSPRNRNVIFAAGHDHSLQYFNKLDGRAQFIVSGSGGKEDFARGGKMAGYVQSERGFSKLLFFKNREVWVEFWTMADAPGSPSGAGGIGGGGSPLGAGGGKVAFRKRLFQGEPPAPAKPLAIVQKSFPDSISTIASNQYKTGIFWRTFFGRGYRKAWQTPVTAPIFNMETEFNDLKPVQQGGSMSSKNLRLETPDGKSYVLRSVKKNILPAVPKEWRWSALHKFYQELKSSSHPYAALVVPSLADAAGVYHTNPKLFFVPKQPGLENYSEVFGGELYLFEERPDGDWSDEPSFGNSPKIIGFTKLLSNLQDDAKHRVDQRWALKSRLLDQWMNDFDRHDDQWRWASFPQADSTILYRPIPRDRDAAFADLRGAVPFVASRRWLRQMQRGLKEKIYDIPGQAKIAIKFDRSFLNELDYNDWMAVAKRLEANLTDAVIEGAFKSLPPEVYPLDAPRVIKKLKARRDRIPRHAEQLYRYLSRYVDVVGTNEKELFEVKRLENGDVEVSVFALGKKEK